MHRILDEHVLMLNRSWVPVGTCTVRSAFGRIFVDRAKFMDTSTDAYVLYCIEEWLELIPEEGMPYVTTAKLKIRVPEILILDSNAMPRRLGVSFSRRNLARRDRMTCQYCGSRPGPQKLTVDHMVPKSKGGKSIWENCILSCFECNSRKADRTPEQANMIPRTRPEMKIMYPKDKPRWNSPYVPAWSPVFKVNSSSLKASWRKFLPDKVMDAIETI